MQGAARRGALQHASWPAAYGHSPLAPSCPSMSAWRPLAWACRNFSVMAAGLDIALDSSFQPFHPARMPRRWRLGCWRAHRAAALLPGSHFVLHELESPTVKEKLSARVIHKAAIHDTDEALRGNEGFGWLAWPAGYSGGGGADGNIVGGCSHPCCCRLLWPF